MAEETKIHETHISLTTGALAAMVENIAMSLKNPGVKPGDQIEIVAPGETITFHILKDPTPEQILADGKFRIDKLGDGFIIARDSSPEDVCFYGQKSCKRTAAEIDDPFPTQEAALERGLKLKTAAMAANL